MNEIEFLEDEMVTIGIGMPLMDTRRFQRIGNRLITPVGGTGFSTFADDEIKRNDEVIREEAQFMLAYLSRLTRLISDAYTEVITGIKVEKPLTSQHWWNVVDSDVPVAAPEGAIIRLNSKKTISPN
jgi:hypothetical protein